MRFKKSNSYTARHSFKVLAIKPPVLRQKDALIKQSIHIYELSF